MEAEIRPKINARRRHSRDRGLSVVESSEKKRLLSCICAAPEIPALTGLAAGSYFS